MNNKEELQEKLRITITELDKKIDQLSGTKGDTKVTMVTGSVNSAGEMYSISALSGETNLPALIGALSRVKMYKREYDDVAEEIGLKNYPVCTWNGYNADTLIKSLEARIKVVANTALITQLKAEKKKLEGFLSEEDRLATTLQSINDLLKK